MGGMSSHRKELSGAGQQTDECAANRVGGTSNYPCTCVAGPSAAKEILQGTVASATVLSNVIAFPVICPGHLPQDTAIIAMQWVASKVQRSV